MGSANVSESFWICRKRWDLERLLRRRGWKATTALRQRAPMSGAEHMAIILSFLDTRNDPQGRMGDLTAERVEEIADWRGRPGVLYQALAETGWIDDAGTPKARWHDYASFNAKRVNARMRQRKSRSKSRVVSRTQSRTQSRSDGSGGHADSHAVSCGTSQSQSPPSRGGEGLEAARLEGGAAASVPEPESPPDFDSLPAKTRRQITDEAIALGSFGSVDRVLEQWHREGRLPA